GCAGSGSGGPARLFEAQTPLTFRVSVSQARWRSIVQAKHPVMQGHEMIVKTVLETPEEVRQSRSDPTVFLFYRLQYVNRWLCVVAKRQDHQGMLITTYPTDAIKEGVKVWPR